MSTPDYADRAFAADAPRIERMTGLVLQHVAADAVRRMIEIGSGSGEQLIALAEKLPRAELVGIDISQPNCDAANAAAAERGLSDRVRFEQADLTTWQTEPADLVYSYSVLHLVPGDDALIAERVAAMVAPGGRLMNAGPYACAFNRVLHGVRVALRTLRCNVTDTMLLRLGKATAGDTYDEPFLRERLVYMYAPPVRYVSRRSQRELAERYGLTCDTAIELPHNSLAQTKHKLFVYRKAGDA